MPSLQWSRYTLGRLAQVLGDAYPEEGDAKRLAERAGCEKLGTVPRGKSSAEEWENFLIFSTNQNKFENFVLEIEEGLTGEVRKEFLKALRFAGSRQFVELLGDNYSKLESAASALLDHEEDLGATLQEVRTIRNIALGLYKEFGNDVSWQALTLMKVSQYEIQASRSQFLAMSMNIINAADYMSAIAKPLLPEGMEPANKSQPIRLSSLGQGTNFSDEARRWQGVIDARAFLHERAQDLYLSLKNSVTLAPES
jgi:hypothetical protein